MNTFDIDTYGAQGYDGVEEYDSNMVDLRDSNPPNILQKIDTTSSETDHLSSLEIESLEKEERFIGEYIFWKNGIGKKKRMLNLFHHCKKKNKIKQLHEALLNHDPALHWNIGARGAPDLHGMKEYFNQDFKENFSRVIPGMHTSNINDPMGREIYTYEGLDPDGNDPKAIHPYALDISSPMHGEQEDN